MARIAEVAGRAERGREIEVPDPDQVDAVDGRDLMGRLHAGGRLDLRDQQLLAVREREPGRQPVGHGVGVVDADATRSVRLEARELDQPPRLVGRLHLRHHHAERAEVEHGRDEVPLRPRDPDERRDARAARHGQQLAHRVHAPAGVLHVVHDEIGSGRVRQAGDAARRELEAHEPEDRLARGELCLEGVLGHQIAVIPPSAAHTAPVTYEASSEARNSITAATSSAVPALTQRDRREQVRDALPRRPSLVMAVSL